MQSNFTLCAISLFGLEAITAEELRKLGFENVRTETGRVLFSSDFAGIARANLALRTAERVLVHLGEFPARSFTELFDGVTALPWENWITREAIFPVKGYALKSTLFSVPDCQAIIKKAIVERLKKHYHLSWLPESGPKYQIQFSILKDTAALYIDTSGAGLHKRGYRPQSVEAPLKETLAAAMVHLSRYQGREYLCDPCCGSGTILIEAAMIASGRWPGISRRFASEAWPQLDQATWTQLRGQAKKQEKPPLALPICGYDIDPEAVKLSQENASRAGVGRHIKVETGDVAKLKIAHHDVIITNPPYGERMLDLEQARRLIECLGSLMKNYHNPLYVISPEEKFETYFGQKADKKRKLYNGMIRCNLYMYYEKKSGIIREIIRPEKEELQ